LSFTTPHEERRLAAPLRKLAQESTDWRGISLSRLAEQYAQQRKAEEIIAAPLVETKQRAEWWPETEGSEVFFDRLRRWVGIF
jgi:hypothetical protein